MLISHFSFLKRRRKEIEKGKQKKGGERGEREGEQEKSLTLKRGDGLLLCCGTTGCPLLLITPSPSLVC